MLDWSSMVYSFFCSQKYKFHISHYNIKQNYFAYMPVPQRINKSRKTFVSSIPLSNIQNVNNNYYYCKWSDVWRTEGAGGALHLVVKF